VRINDRGPFAHDRLIDLSYAAAVRLGVHVKGTALVEVRALEPVSGAREPPPVQQVSAPPPTARAWLQVGSFASRENAERLASQLRDALARPVSVEDVAVGAARVFRVRLGPFTHAAEALDLSGRVSAAGFGSPSLLTE
jgi:rare lipoprotein A